MFMKKSAHGAERHLPRHSKECTKQLPAQEDAPIRCVGLSVNVQREKARPTRATISMMENITSSIPYLKETNTFAICAHSKLI
jgi:hypothetical protein